MKLVSIIVPAYNEEEVIFKFYEKICEVANSLADKYEFEFVFVNDGSRDSTLQKLKQLCEHDHRVNCIDLSRNYGKEIAMLAGFDNVTGDCAITIDADLQEPPATIIEMLKKWECGYDDVFGYRRFRNQSKCKIVTSQLYHKLLNAVSDIDMSDNSGDFRLLDRKCIDALKNMRESQRYTKGLYQLIGFNKTSVLYDIESRVAGTSKFNATKLIKLAVDGITSHSLFPLRLASFCGVFVSIIAFVYMIYVLVKAMIWGDPVAGFPTLLAVILLIGGTILLSLGIIGEYLGRIFIETKQRPPYFINSIMGKLKKQ